ncbi:MAG: polysaccharide biosynthesis protein, partial [Oscillospiraceae bacterium]|nr:polysaccharide biosynthesis protein [Oscillospiraceae bacterium]
MPDAVSSTLLKDKTVMITGGTGSFGNAFLRRSLSDDIAEVRIFSRDEKKQDDMRREIKQNNQNYHKVRYFIGDVRDIDTVRAAIKGVDYLFHAAA